MTNRLQRTKALGLYYVVSVRCLIQFPAGGGFENLVEAHWIFAVSGWYRVVHMTGRILRLFRLWLWDGKLDHAACLLVVHQDDRDRHRRQLLKRNVVGLDMAAYLPAYLGT